MKTSAFSIITLITLFIIIIGIGPVLTIMSLNALFTMTISITPWNYLAVVWLSLIGAGICGGKFRV